MNDFGVVWVGRGRKIRPVSLSNRRRIDQQYHCNFTKKDFCLTAPASKGKERLPVCLIGSTGYQLTSVLREMCLWTSVQNNHTDHWSVSSGLGRKYGLTPSNAEATFVQSTRTKRFLKKHLNPVMLVCIG